MTHLTVSFRTIAGLAMSAALIPLMGTRCDIFPNPNPDPPEIQEPVSFVVFSTGVDDQGVVLGDGAVDPHYVLTVSPDMDYPGPEAVTMNADSLPLQVDFVPNTDHSRWISPRADGGNNLPSGACESEHPLELCDNAYYHYETTFDLTGLDHTTARITGRWALDDGGEIYLNGVSTGIFRIRAPGPDAAFRSWQDFSITSGFQPGLNTLLFVVRNHYFPGNTGDNATGLHVEITSATALGDLCPDDPDKSAPGACGCGTPDADADSNGTPDCLENCSDPLKVSCSVASSVLWPASQQLVNVGLKVKVTGACGPDPDVDVIVYSDQAAGHISPDAAAISPETLQLRSERASGGRIYLIIVKATDVAGRQAADACTVIVPATQSTLSIALLKAKASSALYSLARDQEIPRGFVLLSE